MHQVASEHYHNHVTQDQCFTHIVSCGYFYMWLYHNGHINPMLKLLKIKGLSEEHKLKEKDWNNFSVEDAEILYYVKERLKCFNQR